MGVPVVTGASGPGTRARIPARGSLEARCRGLVADWQANGNSRPLGDPTAATWQDAAAQLLEALDAGADE